MKANAVPQEHSVVRRFWASLHPQTNLLIVLDVRWESKKLRRPTIMYGPEQLVLCLRGSVAGWIGDICEYRHSSAYIVRYRRSGPLTLSTIETAPSSSPPWQGPYDGVTEVEWEGRDWLRGALVGYGLGKNFVSPNENDQVGGPNQGRIDHGPTEQTTGRRV